MLSLTYFPIIMFYTHSHTALWKSAYWVFCLKTLKGNRCKIRLNKNLLSSQLRSRTLAEFDEHSINNCQTVKHISLTVTCSRFCAWLAIFVLLYALEVFTYEITWSDVLFTVNSSEQLGRKLGEWRTGQWRYLFGVLLFLLKLFCFGVEKRKRKTLCSEYVWAK